MSFYEPNEYLSIQEAQQILRYSYKTINFLVQHDKLPHQKLANGKCVFALQDVHNFKNNVQADAWQFDMRNKRNSMSLTH